MYKNGFLWFTCHSYLFTGATHLWICSYGKTVDIRMYTQRSRKYIRYHILVAANFPTRIQLYCVSISFRFLQPHIILSHRLYPRQFIAVLFCWLQIESAMLCDVVQRADENALIPEWGTQTPHARAYPQVKCALISKATWTVIGNTGIIITICVWVSEKYLMLFFLFFSRTSNLKFYKSVVEKRQSIIGKPAVM